MQYNISRAEKNLNELNNFLSLKPNSKIFILLDSNSYTHCLPILIGEVERLYGSEILEVEEGEETKSLKIVENLCQAMVESSADRDSILISLGGGIVTDLGGFVASIFKRGIQHISIPTTLIAMVDASIGGKTAVNLGEVKNQIGTFNHSTIVFRDKRFLETLEKRHIVNGWAEMIKIALVRDSVLWEKIKTTNPYREGLINKTLIDRCISLKERIVREDPNEEGERKILNFGHSLGHAIESINISQGLDILHGEAVASGIYYAIKLSENKLNFPKNKAQEINNYLQKYYNIIELKEYKKLLLNYLIADKKNSNNEFCFILLEDIGMPSVNFIITEEDILNL